MMHTVFLENCPRVERRTTTSSPASIDLRLLFLLRVRMLDIVTA